MTKVVRIHGEPLPNEGSSNTIPYQLTISVGGDEIKVFGHLNYGGCGFGADVAHVPDEAVVTLDTPDARLSLVVAALNVSDS